MNKLHLKSQERKSISFTELQNQKSDLFVAEKVSFYLHDMKNNTTLLSAITVDNIASPPPRVDLTTFVE